jgi:hypothetical protein
VLPTLALLLGGRPSGRAGAPVENGEVS